MYLYYALWSLEDGMWGVLKGGWAVLDGGFIQTYQVYTEGIKTVDWLPKVVGSLLELGE